MRGFITIGWLRAFAVCLLIITQVVIMSGGVQAQQTITQQTPQNTQQGNNKKDYSKIIKNSCQKGRTVCYPLFGDYYGYWDCMKRSCSGGRGYSYPVKKDTTGKTQAAPSTTSTTRPAVTTPRNAPPPKKRPPPLAVKQACEYGQLKCTSLTDDAYAYWYCMQEECKAPPKNMDAHCPDGVRQCKSASLEYGNCRRMICRTNKEAKKSKEKCKEISEKSCAGISTRYWNCVRKTCLGDVKKYRDFSNSFK